MRWSVVLGCSLLLSTETQVGFASVDVQLDAARCGASHQLQERIEARLTQNPAADWQVDVVIAVAGDVLEADVSVTSPRGAVVRRSVSAGPSLEHRGEPSSDVPGFRRTQPTPSSTVERVSSAKAMRAAEAMRVADLRLSSVAASGSFGPPAPSTAAPEEAEAGSAPVRASKLPLQDVPPTPAHAAPRTAGSDSSAPSRSPSDPLAAEVRQVDGARQALAQGRTRAAVTLLESYLAAFPRGVLRTEVLALLVDAHLRSGNRSMAERWFRRLEIEAPTSGYVERYRNALFDAEPEPG